MLVEDTYKQLMTQANKAVVGQDSVFEAVVVAMLAGGHVLLEGVPGTAKTLMARTLATLVSATFKRVQFTPDLMPSDVVGTSVFDLATSKFYLKQGPVFTNLLLADEINRAPAKTQSALLEAMEERQVTIEGARQALPPLFMVLATQNPVEYEGTYPLPEAQLDRFLFKLMINYPSVEAEEEVLRRYDHGFDSNKLAEAGLTAVVTIDTILKCREEIAAIRVDPSILKYVAAIARATRESNDLVLGASPRAGIAILLTAKSLAAVRGRAYVLPDDVKAVVLPVLRHRILLKPETEIEGYDADAVLGRVMAQVAVPR